MPEIDAPKMVRIDFMEVVKLQHFKHINSGSNYFLKLILFLQ
jgi:hypothetical protein